MDPVAANPYAVVLSRPLLLLALVLAEAVVLRIAYRRVPILRLGTWALLATIASVAASVAVARRGGPAGWLISFLASFAAGYVAIVLATRLKPPPLLLRVTILATAASYAVALLALRRGAFLR